jgi:hypothetical protein
MIKKLKLLTTILTILGLLSVISIPSYAIQWDAASWTESNTTATSYSPNSPDPSTDGQVLVTGYINAISTLVVSTSGTVDHGNGSLTIGNDITDLTASTTHWIAKLNVSSNNPLGFSMTIQSDNASKLRRHTWDGSTWTGAFADTSTGEYQHGNQVDYGFGIQYSVDTANNGCYGFYATAASAVAAYPADFTALDSTAGGYVFLPLGDSSFADPSNTDSLLNLPFLDDSTGKRIKHATSGFLVSVGIQNIDPVAERTKLLRGKYDDTITFTLIDGQ